jgi:hypothetical protein
MGVKAVAALSGLALAASAATAAIPGKPRPGEAVVVKPYFSAHAVAMSNARFRIDQLHWAIPTRFVVRNTAGALLTVSRTGGSRGNSFVSSRPKLCRADLRAADASAE